MSHDKHQSASTEAVSGPEALSALMDGELSTFEYRRLIKELEKHPEWLEQWERFHLIRDGLRAEPWAEPLSATQRADGMSLSERIAAEVAVTVPEPAVNNQAFSDEDKSSTQIMSGLNWRQMTARVAVAATVALAVFAGMQNMLAIDGVNTPANMTASREQSNAGQSDGVTQPSAVEMNQNIADASSVVDQDAQRRLNDYIRSVSIPTRSTEQSTPFNILRESPLLRPVSDRELLPAREPAGVNEQPETP